ncbi:MAG: adenylate/guanylate cyclase domain-containing protein [Cyanobacteriota bacterium]|nr:adenylate/guanylate cyclase domain-containing protein [Cyanobacteriota bacterium]
MIVIPALRRSLLNLSGRVPLRTILIVPFVIQIMAAVGLVGYLSFRNGHRAVNDLASQLMDKVGDRIEGHLDDYLNTPHIINQVNAEAYRQGDLQPGNKTGLLYQFWRQGLWSDRIGTIALATAQGDLIGANRARNYVVLAQFSPDPASEGGTLRQYRASDRGTPIFTEKLSETPNYDLRDRSWYQVALRAGQPTWTNIDVSASDKRLDLTAVYPVRGTNDTQSGVFFVDVSLSQIGEFLASLNLSPGGEVYILEPNGNLVASSTVEQPFVLQGKQLERINVFEREETSIGRVATQLRGEFGELNAIDADRQMTVVWEGKPQFVRAIRYRDRLGLDWSIVVVVPESDFMAQIQKNTRTTIGLCSIALVLATAVGIATARWIVHPILQLGKTSCKIARGHFTIPLESDPLAGVQINELKVLGNSFQQMAAQLSQSFMALEKLNEHLEQQVEERTESLQKQEAFLRLILDNIPQQVFWKDTNLVFRGCNRNWAESANLDRPEAVLGKTDYDLLPTREIAETLRAEDRHIIATGESQHRIATKVTPGKSGETVWLHITKLPVRDAEGKTIGILGAIEDITQRHQAQDTLQRQADRDRFLSLISRYLLNLDFDTAIEMSLQAIGKFTQSDRAYIVRFNEEKSRYGISHEWHEEGIEPRKPELQDVRVGTFPWLNVQYHRGQIVKLDRLDDLPPEASAEKAAMERAHTQSFACAPMLYSGQLAGSIVLETVRSCTQWQPENLKLLKLAGEAMAISQARHDAEEALRVEQEKSESLLLNILPEPIAQQLKQKQGCIAEHFDEVTILFADIVGFTPLSARLSPIELVNLLNQIFSNFDDLAEFLGLEKIKTIGDAYMVAAGLPVPREDHAEAIADMAIAMQTAVEHLQFEHGESFQIRIGINSGVVVAGVIGTKKFIYDLWGDAVNVASRMESSGKPGQIQVTKATYDRLKDSYHLQKRGKVSVKGKGHMTTYWLLGKKELSNAS